MKFASDSDNVKEEQNGPLQESLATAQNVLLGITQPTAEEETNNSQEPNEIEHKEKDWSQSEASETIEVRKDNENAELETALKDSTVLEDQEDQFLDSIASNDDNEIKDIQKTAKSEPLTPEQQDNQVEDDHQKIDDKQEEEPNKAMDETPALISQTTEKEPESDVSEMTEERKMKEK
mgnify:FL=1